MVKRNKIKSRFWNFERARRFVRKLRLQNQDELRDWRKSKSFNEKIPSVPRKVYGKDWKGMRDWLGGERKTCRKYDANHNFFKTWSHDMAYILGFWWADGWIYKDKFCISQGKPRKYILQKILRVMRSNYPIKVRKWGVCQFEIQSREIVNDIVSLGGKERKSLDVTFPKIPKNLLPDFVRGYFDGDGCICMSKDARRTKESGIQKINYVANFTSGSKIFIYGLLNILRENIDGFYGYIRRRKEKEKDKTVNGVCFRHTAWNYQLTCGINDARRLKKYMYNESNLKLVEKYKRFDGIGEIKSNYLKTKFVSMKKARTLAISLHLKNDSEWKKHIRSKGYCHIPINPQKVYKNEWNGWAEFLGHNKYVETKTIR